MMVLVYKWQRDVDMPPPPVEDFWGWLLDEIATTMGGAVGDGIAYIHGSELPERVEQFIESVGVAGNPASQVATGIVAAVGEPDLAPELTKQEADALREWARGWDDYLLCLSW